MPIPTEDLISLSVTNFSTNIGVLPNQVINSSNNNLIDISGILSTGDLRYYPLDSNPSGYINTPSSAQSGYIPFSNGNATSTWISPVSPKWSMLRDDFIGGTNADGQVGELGWRRITLAGTPTFAYVSPTENSHHGIVSLAAPATLNQGGSFILGGSNLAPIRDLNSAGWDSYFTFKLLTTGIPMKFRIGFSNSIGAGGAVEATEGIWLRYDTDSAYNDTGYYIASRFSSSNQQSGIGIKPDTDWHTLRIWTNDTLSVNFALDNISGYVTNTNSSVAKFPVINMLGGGGSTSPTVYLDYFGFIDYCGR